MAAPVSGRAPLLSRADVFVSGVRAGGVSPRGYPLCARVADREDRADVPADGSGDVRSAAVMDAYGRWSRDRRNGAARNAAFRPRRCLTKTRNQVRIIHYLPPGAWDRR